MANIPPEPGNGINIDNAIFGISASLVLGACAPLKLHFYIVILYSNIVICPVLRKMTLCLEAIKPID